MERKSFEGEQLEGERLERECLEQEQPEQQRRMTDFSVSTLTDYYSRFIEIFNLKYVP